MTPEQLAEAVHRLRTYKCTYCGVVGARDPCSKSDYKAKYLANGGNGSWQCIKAVMEARPDFIKPKKARAKKAKV